MAEACGWTPSLTGRLTKDEAGIYGPFIDMPNYAGSLDAIHEAVATLTDDQHDEYRKALVDVVRGTPIERRPMAFKEYRALHEATAKQRAIAFLKDVYEYIDDLETGDSIKLTIEETSPEAWENLPRASDL